MGEMLDEIIVTLRHARMFINCKEKMHSDGVKQHDDLVARLVKIKQESEKRVYLMQDLIEREQYIP
jgi:hypothetical protein